MPDDQYLKLMRYLRQLRREGADFTGWMPHYEKGKDLRIEITVKEK